MNLFKFSLVAFFILGTLPVFAAQSGPSLNRSDLKVIADGKNLIKDNLVLWAPDKTAQDNIKLAVDNMEYEVPAFIPTDAPNEYRYQVNPDDILKIKEIHLEGVSISDLYVFFNAPGVKRWSEPSGIDLILSPKKVKNPYYRPYDNSSWGNRYDSVHSEFTYEIQKTKRGYVWKFQLGNKEIIQNFKANSNSIFQLLYTSQISFLGTSAEGFGRSEDETWWTTYLQFNLSQSRIHKFQYNDNNKIIYYIDSKLIRPTNR